MSKHLTVIMGKSLSGKSYVLENIKAEIGSNNDSEQLHHPLLAAE